LLHVADVLNDAFETFNVLNASFRASRPSGEVLRGGAQADVGAAEGVDAVA
jgi:hypothetical protein